MNARPQDPGRVPRLARLDPVPADIDLHALALALDAPALVERGDAAGRETWHVIPLAVAERLDVREAPALPRLQEMLARVRCAPPPEPIPFAGGLVVLLSHDVAHDIERLPSTTQRRDDLPLLHAVACGASLLVPVGGGAPVLAWMPRDEDADGPGLSDMESLELAMRCRHAIGEVLRGAPPREPPGGPQGPVRALWGQEDHEAAVRALIENERAGEIYQANLTQRFEAPWRGSALPLHRHLRRSNPSPFSGWMRDAEGRWELVSGSPERLVRKVGAELVTEPIAGTIPLPDGPSTPPEDVARLAASLMASAKDHAEHVMIVDLHRNDLGRASAPGTVRVEQMMRLDRRSHVIQAIADIRGVAAEGQGPVEIIRAMFPGGCVTGVPKIRAMELLDALERWNRGPYTGSFGFIAGWGDLDLNVIIRSAWRSGGTLAFAAGGGVVLDSDPAAEHRESLAKAAAMRAAIEALAREQA